VKGLTFESAEFWVLSAEIRTWMNQRLAALLRYVVAGWTLGLCGTCGKGERLIPHLAIPARPAGAMDQTNQTHKTNQKDHPPSGASKNIDTDVFFFGDSLTYTRLISLRHTIHMRKLQRDVSESTLDE